MIHHFDWWNKYKTFKPDFTGKEKTNIEHYSNQQQLFFDEAMMELFVLLEQPRQRVVVVRLEASNRKWQCRLESRPVFP